MKSYGANKTLSIPRDVELQSLMQALSFAPKPVRRIAFRLIRTQQTWFANEGLHGLARAKEMRSTWERWIAEGCQLSAIPRWSGKHSLRGRLYCAMRIVAKNPSDAVVINYLTTALRYHENLSISDAEFERHASKPPETVTKRNLYLQRVWAYGLYNPDHDFKYGFAGMKHAEEVRSAYTATRYIREVLHLLMPLGQPVFDRFEPLKSIMGLKPTLLPEKPELLKKAGPHSYTTSDGRVVRLKSVIGEPLDLYALDRCYTIDQSITINDSGELSTRRACDVRTLHEVTDSIAETLLRNPHSGSTAGLVFAHAEAGKDPPPGFKPEVGILVPIKDKAGKIRWIAIVCYTVNKALAPIHNWLYEIIDHFPCDCTVQSKGIERMLLATALHEPCSSTDLSSATDRLPLIAQRAVLEHLLMYAAGYDRAQARSLAQDWHELLSSLEFRAPDGNLYKYGVGQPMGVYTSWVMLAITHHIITLACKWWQLRDKYGITADLEWNGDTEAEGLYYFTSQPGDIKNSLRCALVEFYKFFGGTKENGRYIITGDDNVQFDSAVRPYYDKMMKSLGVETNPNKSIYTDAGAGTSAAKYCKKLAVNGELLSGQSLKVVARSLGLDDCYKHQPILFPQTIKTLTALNGGRTLRRASYSWMLSEYPRCLWHIPLEYGGLGIPREGYTRYQCLAEDGFFIYYMRSQLELATKAWSRTEFEPRSDTSFSTFEGQLQLFDLVKDCSVYPSNPYRKFDNDIRYLYQTKQFIDLSDRHDLRERCSRALYLLNNSIDTGELPEYGDFVEIVDTWSAVRRNLIKTRFTPGLVDRSGYDTEASKLDAFAALSVVKDCRKGTNPWNHCHLGASDLSGVLVDLAETLDLLVRA